MRPTGQSTMRRPRPDSGRPRPSYSTLSATHRFKRHRQQPATSRPAATARADTRRTPRTPPQAPGPGGRFPAPPRPEAHTRGSEQTVRLGAHHAGVPLLAGTLARSHSCLRRPPTMKLACQQKVSPRGSPLSRRPRCPVRKSMTGRDSTRTSSPSHRRMRRKDAGSTLALGLKKTFSGPGQSRRSMAKKIPWSSVRPASHAASQRSRSALVAAVARAW
mmetsp:Transcript_19114/g.64027  ORF Transcript_19114/g.64027 Transcript_19114/m.64027 type:complete len:218 (+) Transcript_19114:16-669(+)